MQRLSADAPRLVSAFLLYPLAVWQLSSRGLRYLARTLTKGNHTA